jgi:hypothetical protein
MNAIERHIEEIIRYKQAIERTKSVYLKNDYSKCVRSLKKELKEYCSYRGYNYKEIVKAYKI